MNDKPKTQEEIDDEAYPSKDYHKKVFPFSKEELTDLAPLEEATKLLNTFLTLGQILQNLKDNYVGGQVLNRMGLKKSPDSKFNYDLVNNKVIVYEPRLWCSVCDVKRAEFKYQDKIYCRDDIEAVRKTLEKPIEEPVQPKLTPEQIEIRIKSREMREEKRKKDARERQRKSREKLRKEKEEK